jgi:tetratricopeptide (TPR) repeat protein
MNQLLNFHSLQRATVCLVAMATMALPTFAQSFTQADLEKMVRELETVSGKHADYKWPIKCSIEKINNVNAFASMEKPVGTEKPQAIMVVFTGLLEAIKYDHRLIRAVIAHEVAHLACGHVDTSVFRARELELLMTRQQEHEADIAGAQYLQKLGYSKKDVVDMLMFLDGLRARGRGWLGGLNSDHATPKARAAKIAEDPSVLKSLVQFDVAHAYLESRKYKMAADMFEVAYTMQPELKEAYTNRAQAMLMFYWDQLPVEQFAEFFRPDFGEAITTPKLAPNRGFAVTPQNLQQYKEALEAIELSITKSGTDRDKELKAIAQILHPLNDATAIKAGIDTLASLKSANNSDKFRYVNNQAVGYIALKDINKAFTMLVSEWKTNRSGNHCAAENLGRMRYQKGTLPKADLELSKKIFEVFLKLTPSESLVYNTVKEGYNLVCGELGVTPNTIEAAPTYLRPAISLFHKGKEIGLFENLQSIVAKVGKANSLTPFIDKYANVFNLRWEGDELHVIGEDLQAMRITSYATDDYLTIRAADERIRSGYEVKVGMTVVELDKLLGIDSGKPFNLVGKTGLESWTYFGALNFGVLIADGKVTGITMTSVYDPDKD